LGHGSSVAFRVAINRKRALRKVVVTQRIIGDRLYAFFQDIQDLAQWVKLLGSLKPA
jgi:hypothetical protein